MKLFIVNEEYGEEIDLNYFDLHEVDNALILRTNSNEFGEIQDKHVIYEFEDDDDLEFRFKLQRYVFTDIVNELSYECKLLNINNIVDKAIEKICGGY